MPNANEASRKIDVAPAQPEELSAPGPREERGCQEWLILLGACLDQLDDLVSAELAYLPLLGLGAFLPFQSLDWISVRDSFASGIAEDLAQRRERAVDSVACVAGLLHPRHEIGYVLN